MKLTDGRTKDLFPELLDGMPPERAKRILLRNLKHPIWTHHKASLIERYLYFFVMVTHHGTYIDGFAGTQYEVHQEAWAAKRVLESRPRQLRNFFLCELDPDKCNAIKELWQSQPPREPKEAKRVCEIRCDDFNVYVNDVLASGVITEKEAAFALLDHRTLECHWETVKRLAQHKKTGNKIELFYFVAVKWLHRSLAGLTANDQRALAWWGRDDWRSLSLMSQRKIVDVVRERFENELGYAHVVPFPIYEKEEGGGSVMYYMIHASDHDDAPKLMWRAYHQAILTKPPEQLNLPLAGA